MNFLISIWLVIVQLFTGATITAVNSPIDLATTTPNTTVQRVDIPVSIPVQSVDASSTPATTTIQIVPVIVPVYIPAPVQAPTTVPVPVQETPIIQPNTSPATMATAEPAPAPKFVDVPAITVQKFPSVNVYSVKWNSDIPSTATFNICVSTTDPSQCIVQKEFSENTAFDYELEWNPGSIGFYSIGIKANGQTTWYYNQLPQ